MWIWFDLGSEYRVEVPMRVGSGGFERCMATLLENLSIRIEKRSIVNILHDIEATEHDVHD
jgi:hypothetical protein